jgi:hypothetical protein
MNPLNTLSALAENEKYLDSIAGKLSEFEATFQQMALDFVDSGLIKGVVDFGTGVLNAVDAVGGLGNVLILATGLLIAFGRAAIVSGLETFALHAMYAWDGIKNLIKSIATVLPWTKAYATAQSSLNAQLNLGKLAATGLIAIIGVLTVAYSGLKMWSDGLAKSQEEERQRAIASGDAAQERVDTLVDLYERYKELDKILDRTSAQEAEYQNVQSKMIESIDERAKALDRLTASTKGYKEELAKALNLELKDEFRNIQDKRVAAENALDAYADNGMFGAGSKKLALVFSNKKLQEQITNILNEYLVEDEYKPNSKGMFVEIPKDATKQLQFYLDLKDAISTISEEANKLNEASLLEIKNSGFYKGLNAWADEMQPLVDQVIEGRTNEAWVDSVIDNGVPETIDDFNILKESVFQATGASEDFKDTIFTIVNNAFPSLSGASSEASDAIEETGNTLGSVTESATALSNAISALEKSYANLKKAQDEMADGGGLSSSTTAAVMEELAAAGEDYLDYLYTENGLLKLNTSAYETWAHSRILADKDALESKKKQLEADEKTLASAYSKRNVFTANAGGKNVLDNYLETIGAESYADALGAINSELSDTESKLEILQAILNSLNSETLMSLDTLKRYIAGYGSAANEAVRDDWAGKMDTALKKLREQVVDGTTSWNEYEDAVRSVEQATHEYVNSALSKLADEMKAVKSINEDLADGNGITAESYASLITLYPELENAVGRYLLGLMSEKELHEEITAASEKGLQKEKEIAAFKIATTLDEVKQLATLYGIDVSNVETAAELKLAIHNAEAEGALRITSQQVQDAADIYGLDVTNYTDSLKAKLIADKQFELELTRQKQDKIRKNMRENREDMVVVSTGMRDIAALNEESNALEEEINRILGLDFGAVFDPIEIELNFDPYGGSSSKSNTHLDSLLDDGKLYLEQLKDLEEALEESDKLIDQIQSDLSFAEDIGDEDAANRHNAALLKAYEERNRILQDALANTKSLTTEIEKTFPEFSNVDMSEFGIADFRRNLQNEITALENRIAKTDDEALKHRLEQQKQILEDRSKHFDEYVESFQYANEQEETFSKAISENERESYRLTLQINDELSNNTLGTLKEIYGMTGDEISYREALVKLIEDENISLEQQKKLRQDLADFDQSERYQEWLGDSEFELSVMERDGADPLDIVRKQRAILSGIHDEIKYWTDLGYTYQSDKIQELTADLWRYEDAISSSLEAIVTSANESLDGIQNVFNTLKDAAKEFSEYGYITVDTFQSIAALGVENLAYLKDENGQLVINEESLKRAIAAKTQESAATTAMNYVRAIGIALTEKDTKALNNLLYATQEATGGTWDLVYASLSLLQLNGEQYNAAKSNIDALRALADSAVESIGRVDQSLSESLKAQETAYVYRSSNVNPEAQGCAA